MILGRRRKTPAADPFADVLSRAVAAQTIALRREYANGFTHGVEMTLRLLLGEPADGGKEFAGPLTPEAEAWAREALARDLIVPLQDGLAALRATPDRYRELDPPNGWGDYDLLVSFVERYLAACEDYPLAEVQVSR